MLPVKSFRGDAAHELRAGTEVVTATSTESSHEDTKQIFKLRFDALVVWSGGRVFGFGVNGHTWVSERSARSRLCRFETAAEEHARKEDLAKAAAARAAYLATLDESAKESNTTLLGNTTYNRRKSYHKSE